MEELIYNTKFLFQGYLQMHKCEFFNIPEYQRGYKWTKENAIQLLNDLSNFKKTTKDEFYCLQNITITRTKLNGHPCFNVIDGQQRLTTLFIILSFIQRNFVKKIIPVNSNLFEYSIRDTTNKFLRNNVLSGELWKSEIDLKTAESKDQYYIMEVAKAISEWFNIHNTSKLKSTILDDLKLIVNVVDSEEEETIFASLNGGKVDLDGADLVRAILITRAAKQKYPQREIVNKGLYQLSNDDINLNINISVSSQGKINEFRVKIGIELDKINQWWSDKHVRTYFEQLLSNNIVKNKNFLYKNYPIDLLYYAFFEAYNKNTEKNDLDIKFFENGRDCNNKEEDDHLELYYKVHEFHLTMVDWYNDIETYNLVGYLMFSFKSPIITFECIWKIWQNSGTKSIFKNKIKSIIRFQLAVASSQNVDDIKNTFKKIINDETIPEIEKGLSSLRERILDINYNWYEDSFTQKFLPLLDILPFYIESKKKNDRKIEIKRINTRYLKRTSLEDREHVRSQKRSYDEQNPQDVEALLEENRKGLNSIGNLVLLHESVNRSYGNDELIKKMVRIYSEHILDNENSYIRPHTFDVFMSKMKNMDQNGLSNDRFFWSDEDINRTVKAIDRSISEYLSFPNLNNNLIEEKQ